MRRYKQISYTTESFDYTSEYSTIDRKIDFFELQLKDFSEKGTKYNIELGEDEYLSIDKHLYNINHETRETVILNVQTGKGKTSICYDLIEKYANKGYIVIVLSPFTKLVEKDYEALKKRSGLKVFNYAQLTNDIVHRKKAEYLNCNVQIMTVNCLLQNPGKDAIAQSRIKQKYLADLLSFCTIQNKKVVIFFDEIHESTANLHSEYVPNLLKWDKVVHKCYISSATYTPASIAAIQYIGILTDYNTSIYEVARKRVSNPAQLYLHVTSDEYGEKDLQPLSPIINIINSNPGKKINILTGYRTIAKALIKKNGNDANTNIVDSISKLKPIPILSGLATTFNSLRNNIGTAFKTGINIQGNDSIYIIIMPYIKEQRASYGIFNDGIPSIIQALGRLRSTKDVTSAQIHIFMPTPRVILDMDTCNKSLPIVLQERNEVNGEKYKHQFSAYEQAISLFKRYSEHHFSTSKSDVIPGINVNNREMDMTDIEDYEKDFIPKFSSRSQYDFLIEKSQNLLLKNNYGYGKELSAYVLWAALHNQFCNATLKGITYTTANIKRIAVTNKDIEAKLRNILTSEVLLQCKKHDLNEGINYLIDSLEYVISETNHLGELLHKKLILLYDNKEYTVRELRTSTFLKKALINIYVQAYTEHTITELSKQDYILNCCLLAGRMKQEQLTTERAKAYYMLNQSRIKFLNWLRPHLEKNKKGETIIHKDIFSKIHENDIMSFQEVIKKINTEDILVKSKIYPFTPKINSNTFTKETQAAIYTQFEKCFTNISRDYKILCVNV